MPARPPGTFYLLTRPSLLLLHVLGTAAVVAAALLGWWQVGAWQLHREDTAAELVDADPVPLREVLGPDDPFPGTALGQPVEVRGRWLPADTFFVADREVGGATGHWMVTPVDTGEAVLPVVLGWTTTVADAPSPPSGAADVTGWLQPGEGAGAPDLDPTDDVFPTLRIASVSQRFDQDLYGGFAILQQPAGPRGDLTPVTPESLPEAPAFTGLRNLLYGVEWWVFGCFAGFLWWRWARDEMRVLRARAAGPPPEGEQGGVSPVSRSAEQHREEPAPRLPSRS